MLTPDELEVLEFERSWWLRPGPKDQCIEFDLGLSAESYYETLLDIVFSPAAYQADPLTIARLRGIIDTTPLLGEAVI